MKGPSIRAFFLLYYRSSDEMRRTRLRQDDAFIKSINLGGCMSSTQAWIVLVIAGLLEICWAIGLKYTDGFTKLTPTIFTVLAMVVSMYMLGKAASVLPIGTAYGVWVGIGTVGASILGIVLFKEPASVMKIVFLVMLISSIVGLKLSSH